MNFANNGYRASTLITRLHRGLSWVLRKPLFESEEAAKSQVERLQNQLQLNLGITRERKLFNKNA